MGTPSSAHHLDALTGVRAFAALWVFVFHSWLNGGSPTIRLPVLTQSIDLTPLAAFGWLGLDVFFVLSGFLLTRQACLKAERSVVTTTSTRFVAAFGEKYSSYLRRRILRVYPAYYACLTALLILAATGVYLRLPGKLELLLHLGMVHNFIERYIATMNGVFWTLPFEWQFYLIFPLLFVMLRRYGAWVLYGSALIGVIGTKLLVMATNDGYPQVLLPIRLDTFAAGMCAGAYAFYRPPAGVIAAALFWAGLIGLLATPWVFGGYPQVGHYYDLKGFLRPPWIQASICFMLLGLTGRRHAGVRIFDNAVAVALGLISYSIYLLHVPILELLPTLGLIPPRTTDVEVGWPRILGSALPVVLLLSALSYWFIERPFQASGKVWHRTVRPRRRFEPFAAVDPLFLLLMWAIALELFLFVHAD
jgi:peptidoglycan/LPS O-acetylase OafA/YrhL